MQNETDFFSMKPTTQAQMDDLAERGIEWIRDKLAEAEHHVRNVQEIRKLATEQGLNEEEYYCLLAYRAVTEMIDMVQLQIQAAQRAPSSGLIVNPEGDVLSSESEAPKIIV